MTMTNYPGNTSLPLEVKERVVSTFKQAVDLYKQGRKEEVSAGCDFLLKMDPMFEPAKKLLAKSRNPLLDIDVDTLVPATGGGAASLAEAKTALAHRDFQRALDLCSAALAANLTNEEAQTIAGEAREKLEAGPFIDQFCSKARNEIQRGNASAARSYLAKAKALDEGHPSIAAMEAMLNAPAAAASPAAGASSFDFGSGSPGFGSSQGSGFDSFSFGTPTVGDSSFVVDNKPAAPAGAPASDFGFTFEEEQKPADPSFAFGGGTAPTPIVGEAQTFDFATASVEVSAEDQAKIDGYLAEGDQAFSAGDAQKAIDIWSRIFLIDVTNEQASERIEKARAKRLDIDRKIEDLITAGSVAVEKKDVDTARKKFEEALKLDPTHAHAKELLGELQSTRPTGAAPAFAPSAASAASPAAPPIDLFDDDFSAPAREVNADVLQIPDAAAAPKARAAAAAAPAGAERAASRPPSKVVPIAVAALFVIVLVAGGWLGYTKFFGKGGSSAAATEATMQQAQTLAKEGNLDKAISLLLTIPADDPQHDKVLNLLEDLKNRKSQASSMINGKPAAVVFNEQLRAGKAAFELHDYMGAKRAYEQAAAIQPLPPDAQALYSQATQQVAKLDSSLILFKEGNYKDAIGSLQALQQQDPENPNIAQLIASAHFNIGRAALQEERTADAMAEFSEVLKTEPNDDYAKRSLELATRYDGQPKDLLYKIYVKYLPLR